MNTAYRMKSDTFWDLMSFNLIEVYRRFGGTYCLSKSKQSKHEGKRATRVKTWFRQIEQRSDSACLHTLFLDHEYGGNMLLRNVGHFYQTTWHNIPEDGILRSHSHENLNSHNLQIAWIVLSSGIEHCGYIIFIIFVSTQHCFQQAEFAA
jgi:hypothetical protein